MARKFSDTSAVVKLYVDEPDSADIQIHIEPSDELVISRLTLLEFRSALFGKVRQGTLTLADAQARNMLFSSDVANFTLKVLPVDYKRVLIEQKREAGSAGRGNSGWGGVVRHTARREAAADSAGRNS